MANIYVISTSKELLSYFLQRVYDKDKREQLQRAVFLFMNEYRNN